jgi:hypothetical protein
LRQLECGGSEIHHPWFRCGLGYSILTLPFARARSPGFTGAAVEVWNLRDSLAVCVSFILMEKRERDAGLERRHNTTPDKLAVSPTAR